MTVASVFESISSVLTYILGAFSNVASDVMENPLLFVPIIITITGSLILFAISVFRKLGIRGTSSSGRRRRR